MNNQQQQPLQDNKKIKNNQYNYQHEDKENTKGLTSNSIKKVLSMDQYPSIDDDLKIKGINQNV